MPRKKKSEKIEGYIKYRVYKATWRVFDLLGGVPIDAGAKNPVEALLPWLNPKLKLTEPSCAVLTKPYQIPQTRVAIPPAPHLATLAIPLFLNLSVPAIQYNLRRAIPRQNQPSNPFLILPSHTFPASHIAPVRIKPTLASSPCCDHPVQLASLISLYQTNQQPNFSPTIPANYADPKQFFPVYYSDKQTRLTQSSTTIRSNPAILTYPIQQNLPCHTIPRQSASYASLMQSVPRRFPFLANLQRSTSADFTVLNPCNGLPC